MCGPLQIKIQLAFEAIFSYWADVVSKRTTCIFLFSLVVNLALSVGFVFFQNHYKQQNRLWTPKDNETFRNMVRAKDFFGTDVEFRSIKVIVEAKDDNLLTLEAFEEMIQFEKILYSVTELADTHLNAFNDVVRSNEGDVFKFSDICSEFYLIDSNSETFSRCQSSSSPLDFIYDKATNSYQLEDVFATDQELLVKIQTGKGDPQLFQGNNFLFLDNIFAQTQPETVQQQVQINNPLRPIGQNNIEKAKYASFEYYIDTTRFTGTIEEEALLGFEQNLQKAVSEWTETTQAIRVIMLTEYGFIEAWSKDVEEESGALWIASLAVLIYLILFLGACSPIFCRAVVALSGAISIIGSFTSGFGLLFFCGYKISSFHGTIPFLMMSIGVEQMFVVTDAIDQVTKEKTAYEKLHNGLSTAGPAITITTLTTASAFAFGMISSLEALRSFCLFAAVCCLVLYFNMMTFFLASMVWDTKRQQQFKKDCFGLFCCAESSRFFCKGKFVSKELREHVGNIQFAIYDESKLAESIPSLRPKHIKEARDKIKDRSFSERCCGMCWAPILLTNVCRIVVLVIFAIIIIVAGFQILELRVFIDQMVFVSQESDVYDWFKITEQQFKAGTWEQTTICVENPEINFAEIERQYQIHDLDTAISTCEGCENKWHKDRTLKSWYSQYWDWVSVGYCARIQPATIPGQRIVVPEDQFYDCLNEWFNTDYGRNMKRTIKQDQSGKIIGWREYIDPIKTSDVFKDGPKYLNDIDKLFKTYGITETYAYSDSMLTMETFKVLVDEFIISSAASISAIFFVIILITGSPRISLLTVASVLLTDFFLLALMPLVNINFNNVVVAYLVTSLGLSVLYSVHISHTFLIVVAPNTLKPYKQRQVKARVALSRMGASVLHGAVVTLLFIGIVAIFQKSYFFEVFFKLWLGIVFFGCLNAFMLIPVIMSFIGPTPNYVKKAIQRRKSFMKRLSQLSPQQLKAVSDQYNFDGDELGMWVSEKGAVQDVEVQTFDSMHMRQAEPQLQSDAQYAVDEVEKGQQHWLMSKMTELFFKANANSIEQSQLSPAEVSEADEDDEVSNNLGASNNEEAEHKNGTEQNDKESQTNLGNAKSGSKGKGKGKGKGGGKGKGKGGKGKKGSASKKGKKGVSQTEVKQVQKGVKWFSKDAGIASSDESRGAIELQSMAKLQERQVEDRSNLYQDQAIGFHEKLGSGLLGDSHEDNNAQYMNEMSQRGMLLSDENDNNTNNNQSQMSQMTRPRTMEKANIIGTHEQNYVVNQPDQATQKQQTQIQLQPELAAAIEDLQRRNQDLSKTEAMQVIEELKRSVKNNINYDSIQMMNQSPILAGLNISQLVNDYVAQSVNPSTDLGQKTEAFNFMGAAQKNSVENFADKNLNISPSSNQDGHKIQQNSQLKIELEDPFKAFADENPKAFDTQLTFNQGAFGEVKSPDFGDYNQPNEKATQREKAIDSMTGKEFEKNIGVDDKAFAKEAVSSFLPKI